MSDLIMPLRSTSSRVFGLPRAFSFLVAFLICVAPAVAEHTRFWRQSDYDAFQKGDAKGVALRSDGKLLLAPKFAPFADTSLAYLWALRLDSHGNLYAGGGSNAKIMKFDNGGNSTTVFESQDMTAQALVFDKSDNLYVATAPDGKVYKVTPAGQKSVFFDPKTKYIWDLALGPDGTLFVATGDPGKIFAVDPSGNSQLFYNAEETHVRTLVLDGKGNLLAGTEPNGLVLRISLGAESTASQSAKTPAARQPSGKRAASQTAAQTAAKKEDSSDEGGRPAYVVYETSKKEVTALALDPSGNLYVAAIGEKRPGPPQPPVQQAEQENAPNGQTITVTVGAPGGLQQPQQATPFVPFPALSSAAVYRIAPDGSPEEIWTSRENSVYAMGISPEGSPGGAKTEPAPSSNSTSAPEILPILERTGVPGPGLIEIPRDRKRSARRHALCNGRPSCTAAVILRISPGSRWLTCPRTLRLKLAALSCKPRECGFPGLGSKLVRPKPRPCSCACPLHRVPKAARRSAAANRPDSSRRLKAWRKRAIKPFYGAQKTPMTTS